MTSGYSYDNDGRLTSPNSGTTTYSYDDFGQLTSVTMSGGVEYQYTYDGLGRRVTRKKFVSSTEATSEQRRYLYAQGNRLVAMYDSNGNILQQFVYATGRHVPDAVVAGSVLYRIVSDHLGSVRLVVNASDGTVVQQTSYDAWGVATNTTIPSFGIIPFGFAGGLRDTDSAGTSGTGLTQMGARWYDPVTGRWISKDPIRLAGGTNLYAYVGNDPVNKIDPLGLRDYGEEQVQSMLDEAIEDYNQRTPAGSLWCALINNSLLGRNGRYDFRFAYGLFLPRDVVFGEPGLEGDVDIIAGPMTYGMTELEFAQQRKWMAAQVELATPVSVVDSFALMKAAEDGLVEWPPHVKPLVGCEVKASWYDVEQGSWKATHENEGRRISGQLRQLVDRGVDRCAYLHLGFTQARAPHPGWAELDPWLRAGSDVTRAGVDFPAVTLGPEVVTSGYYTAVVAAVHHATENFSGAAGALAIVREALDNPHRASADASWRANGAPLLALLRRFPTPRAVPAFIVYCKQCDRYGLAGSASSAAVAACPCGSSDA